MNHYYSRQGSRRLGDHIQKQKYVDEAVFLHVPLKQSVAQRRRAVVRNQRMTERKNDKKPVAGPKPSTNQLDLRVAGHRPALRG